MNNLTYTNRNGYQIPNLVMDSREGEPETLTRFGRAREKYLMEHRKALYTSLLLKGTLWSHLTEIDQAANEHWACRFCVPGNGCGDGRAVFRHAYFPAFPIPYGGGTDRAYRPGRKGGTCPWKFPHGGRAGAGGGENLIRRNQ